jgi:hypothetical protein
MIGVTKEFVWRDLPETMSSIIDNAQYYIYRLHAMSEGWYDGSDAYPYDYLFDEYHDRLDGLETAVELMRQALDVATKQYEKAEQVG